MALFKKIIPVREDDVNRIMSLSIVVPLAGVIHELGLPIEVDADSEEIGIHFQEDDWPDILERKEDVRAALHRRGLDVLMIRRVMRLIFAVSVEEP